MSLSAKLKRRHFWSLQQQCRLKTDRPIELNRLTSVLLVLQQEAQSRAEVELLVCQVAVHPICTNQVQITKDFPSVKLT